MEAREAGVAAVLEGTTDRWMNRMTKSCSERTRLSSAIDESTAIPVEWKFRAPPNCQEVAGTATDADRCSVPVAIHSGDRLRIGPK